MRPNRPSKQTHAETQTKRRLQKNGSHDVMLSAGLCQNTAITILCKVSYDIDYSSSFDRERLVVEKGGCVDRLRLPLRSGHAGAAHGVAYADAALEGGDAHHVWVALGGLVCVLEADVLVAVVPGCYAGEESAVFG